jgi:hypothetical protein
MQLVAYGAQDVYLTGNPQITFWKVTYRRHTNFSMESIEQTFNGQADFGRRVTCTISRNGDLAYRTYLQVTLPEVNCADVTNGNQRTTARWLDYPGEHLIHHVEVEIGGQRIDRQYGDWMHIWNQLTLTAEAKRGYDKMVGHTPQLTYLANPYTDDNASSCGACTVAQDCQQRNSLPETTLYVPLQFWYCRNPGLALPLIALQYHEVKINLELRPIDEMLWGVWADSTTGLPLQGVSSGDCEQPAAGGLLPANNSGKASELYKNSLVAASLYVDYVFLDTDERRRMAQNPHEYLIEQLQYTGDESIGSSSNKIKLNFNHPVKEMVWVVQKDENVDYCKSLDFCGDSCGDCGDSCGDCCGSGLYASHGAQPFNYTDAIDVLPNSFYNYGNPVGSRGAIPAIAGPMGDLANNLIDGLANGFGVDGTAPARVVSDCNVMNGVQTKIGQQGKELELDGTCVSEGGLKDGERRLADDKNQRAGGVTNAAAVVLAKTAHDHHCWGQNPVVVAKLQLNGQDRFSEREGTYFDLVQPYQHHTRNPDTGINVYSFALRPEEHQPSGTCNFSRIDNATLQVVVSNNTVSGHNTAKVRVYATNYNVLRVMSGMGGLAYSN